MSDRAQQSTSSKTSRNERGKSPAVPGIPPEYVTFADAPNNSPVPSPDMLLMGIAIDDPEYRRYKEEKKRAAKLESYIAGIKAGTQARLEKIARGEGAILQGGIGPGGGIEEPKEVGKGKGKEAVLETDTVIAQEDVSRSTEEVSTSEILAKLSDAVSKISDNQAKLNDTLIKISDYQVKMNDTLVKLHESVIGKNTTEAQLKEMRLERDRLEARVKDMQVEVTWYRKRDEE